ncbi:hypothetical protein GGI10_000787 [Coemansia sp. RSA 2530]|nr:hypothetical protein GGI10_000787 [Coemansia sp. RSA 2530]
MASSLSHLALALALLVSHTASAIPQPLSIHQSGNHSVGRALFGNWPSINTYRGAILVRNDRQTACEFALIDQRSAFIAASCLDLKPGTATVEDSTRHEIFFDNAKGLKATSSPIRTADIHIHPNFDPASYANNIAVVTFTMDQKRTWTNDISVNRDEWTNALFVRRYMSSVRSMGWRAPMVNSGAWGGFAGCAAASGIYSSNQRDFVCSTESSSISTVSVCRLPYSSVNGIVLSNMATAALHSHTVIEGSSMCGAKQTFHYYTLLASYVGFAKKVIGYDPAYFTASGDFSSNIDPDFKMQPPAFGIPKGMRLFGGDVFEPGVGAIGTDETPPPPPPPPPPLPSPPSPDNPAVPSESPSIAPSVTPDIPVSNVDVPGGPAPTTPPAATASATKTATSRLPSTNANSGNRPQSVATDGGEPPKAENGSDAGARPSRPPSTASRTLSNGSVVPVYGNAGMLTGAPGYGDGAFNDNYQEPEANGGGAAANKGSLDEDEGGLSKGKIVAIGIFVPIALIGLVAGSFYGMRWYRRRRLEKSWNPSEVQQIVDTQMTENELGLSSDPANFQLPSYRNYSNTMLIATSPGSSSR